MTDEYHTRLVKTVERSLLASMRTAVSTLELAHDVFGSSHPTTNRLSRELHTLVAEEIDFRWRS